VNKKAFRADIMLLLTACIWGFGFVAQRSGMDYVGPFTFNAIRFVIGSLSLLPLIFIRRARGVRAVLDGSGSRSRLLGAFILIGAVLFIAVALQQLGMLYTSTGNAGFITGLYVVLTPIFGIFIGKKTGIPTWAGAACDLAGLYFLSAAGHGGKINPGDMLMLVSAVFWAIQVLLTDYLVQRFDAIVICSGQFAVCGVLMTLCAFAFEPLVPALSAIIAPGYPALPWKTIPELLALLQGPISAFSLLDGSIPILYGGFVVVGIAYTLQAVAQKDAPPAHATIIMSFEGSFAALGGILLLGEKIGPYTLLGFALMLGGMIITQWELIFGSRH
jgi:drug/metabolite transporter (DMT)-like permease